MYLIITGNQKLTEKIKCCTLLNLIKKNIINIFLVTGKINAVLIINTQMVLALVSIALRHF